jgi:hypothetical protein
MGAFVHLDGRPVDMAFEAKQLDGLIRHLRQIHQDVPARSMEESTKQLLDSLPFFGNLTAQRRFPRILRLVNSHGRLKNERITSISDLTAPQRGVVKKYNRCCMPDESMTLVEETKPQVGHRVTIVTWELQDDFAITYCPIFLNQPTSSWNPRTWRYYELYKAKLREFPAELQPMVEELSRFVADTFTRPSEDLRNDLEYLFCGYFASRMLYRMDGDNADAIWYPSVKAGLTRENIALKPEVLIEHYNPVKVEEYVVGETLRYSDEAVIMSGGMTCERFDYERGIVLWQ